VQRGFASMSARQHFSTLRLRLRLSALQHFSTSYGIRVGASAL
jgi:hypothetical protein